MRVWLQLPNSQGEGRELTASAGETIFATLLRNHIPPQSAVAFEEGSPLTLFYRLSERDRIDVYIPENFDIEKIRRRYSDPGGAEPAKSVAHMYRRTSLTGARAEEQSSGLTLDQLSVFVEDRLVETVDYYDLFAEDENIVLGFSGGIDSSALLRGLHEVSDRIPDIDIHAVTIGDFWPEGVSEGVLDPTAHELLDRVDATHRVVDPVELREIFNLTTDISEALSRLREDSTRDVLSVASTINRRALEHSAEIANARTICVGDHASDLVAGHLQRIFDHSGGRGSTFPKRGIGANTYVYPFSFHSKQQLALYNYFHNGVLPAPREGDPWKLNPMRRHFYYYLADMLQSYCPGFVHWLAEETSATADTEAYTRCSNCEKLLQNDQQQYCVACTAFDKLGVLAR